MKSMIKFALCIALSLMCMFTCIGYAALSETITIRGNVEAKAPYAVFIVSATPGGMGSGRRSGICV